MISCHAFKELALSTTVSFVTVPAASGDSPPNSYLLPTLPEVSVQSGSICL